LNSIFYIIEKLVSFIAMWHMHPQFQGTDALQHKKSTKQRR